MISALEEKAYIGLLKKWYPKSSQNKRKRTFPLCRCGDGNDQSFTLHIKCTFSIGRVLVFMNVNKVTCRSFWGLRLSTFTQILHWSSIWAPLLEWLHFMQLYTSTELHLNSTFHSSIFGSSSETHVNVVVFSLHFSDQLKDRLFFSGLKKMFLFGKINKLFIDHFGLAWKSTVMTKLTCRDWTATLLTGDELTAYVILNLAVHTNPMVYKGM